MSVNLQDLHNIILMIAKDFDEFCIAHNIEYYMMGGTALGAIRHQGFIPWDDDFDVFMDRKNYKKYLHVAKHFLDKKKYYLQLEDTKEWPLFFSKLRLNDTLYIEKEDISRDIHKGIFIDIMCLNNTFSNKYLRYTQYFCARILSATALAKRGYNTKSKRKKLALILSYITRFYPIKLLLLGVVRGLNCCKTKYIAHFFGRAPFNNTSFERAYLSPARRVKFNNLELPVPKNVESYLTTRFGTKYMDMPSKKIKDKYPMHALEVQLGSWKANK